MLASVSSTVLAALAFTATVRGAPTPDRPAAAIEERAGESNTQGANDGNVPLWSSNGPQPQDVKQTTLSDCWLDATMVAITSLSPDWIVTRFANDKGSRFEQAVEVTLTGPNFQNWVTNIYQADLPYYLGSDSGSSSSENWWPAAIEVAVDLTAPIFEEGSSLYTGGQPDEALRMLTGRDATSNEDKSTWWRLIESNCHYTPMVVGTWNNATGDIVGSHAYSVVDAGVDEATSEPYVELHNPWGLSRQYFYNDIIDSLRNLYYITDLHQYDPTVDV